MPPYLSLFSLHILLFIASVFVPCRFFLDFGYIAWHCVLARSSLIFSVVLPLLDPVSSLLHCRRLRQFLQFLCRCCCRCCRCLLFVVSFCAVLWTLHFFLTLEFRLLGPLPDSFSVSLPRSPLFLPPKTPRHNSLFVSILVPLCVAVVMNCQYISQVGCKC